MTCIYRIKNILCTIKNTQMQIMHLHFKNTHRSITSTMSDDEHESWDAPLRRQTVPWANNNVNTRGTSLLNKKKNSNILRI